VRSPSRGNARGGPCPGSARADPEAVICESGFSALGRTRTANCSRSKHSVRHARARGARKRASTTQASPACARHELRHEVSEPIGLGRSSQRERSRWEVPSRGKLTLARPLARDISAGRAVGVYVDKRSHPQLNAGSKVLGCERGCTGGRPRVGSCGVLVVRGRARGSHRLQKSTGGAWPFTSGLGTKSPRAR